MLGIRMKTVVKEIQISQKLYIEKILKKFSIMSCKLRSTPLPVGISLLTNDLLISKKKIAEIKKVMQREKDN